MTQAQLDLLRRMAAQAMQADMDMGVGANVMMALLDEIDRLRASLARADRLVSHYRYMLRYVPQDEYDVALARLQAFESSVEPS